MIIIHYDVDWTTLGEYLQKLQTRGIAPNVASFVGAGTVRVNVVGERDIQPTPEELIQMRTLVRHAMEEGALGVTTALIYSPNGYAKTPELMALAGESARCGGIYIAHMRSEGTTRRAHPERASRPICYTYTAGATGLDAAMPPWVQDGGLEAWISHLKDPAVRARVITDMRDPHPYGSAGAGGTLLLAFKNPALKPLTGKTLAEVARTHGVSPEDAAIDLVIQDGTRVGVAYFLMSADNVRRQTALPWVSFGSDEAAPAPEGVFLQSNPHPRAYGNFARLLAKYVRKEHVLTLPEAICKLSAQPALNLSLADRGMLRAGYFADVVIFDAKKIQDHATYAQPHQLATGVSYVLVNGRVALKKGTATGAPTGRFARPRLDRVGRWWLPVKEQRLDVERLTDRPLGT